MILVNIICSVLMSVTFVNAGTIECINGEVSLDDDSCVCQPDYTGVYCEFSLLYEEQKKFQEKLEQCHSDQPVLQQNENEGSGSGSGEGSGTDPTDPPITCTNEEQRPVEGKCKFVNFLSGNVVFSRNLTMDQAQCVLTTILSKLNGFIDLQLIAGDKVVVFDPDHEPFTIDLIELTNVDANDIEQRIAKGLIVQRRQGGHSFEYKMAVDELNTESLMKALQGGLPFADSVSLFSVGDINDCKHHANIICGNNSDCTNLIGSYECACRFNYTDVTSEDERRGTKCRHVCMAEYGKNDPYCQNEGVCSITVEGRAVCECPMNYAGDQCENEWHVFLNATIGLAVALGILLIIFIFVTIMLCFRSRLKKTSSKANLVEMESANSANGEYNAANETTEIKGISNPYVSSDEGITVATNAKIDDDPDAPEVEEDRL